MVKLILLLLLSASVNAEQIIIVYVQDTVLTPQGTEVAGYADNSGLAPVIKINKNYLECFAHEYRHLQEGEWHGKEANSQCD